MPTTTETIHLYAVKGGQGTTTVAAALALLSARSGFKTALVSEGNDLPAILGTSEREAAPNLHQITAAPNLHQITVQEHNHEPLTGYGLVIVDHGLKPGGVWAPGRKLLVTRGPCYLALRAAMACFTHPDGVILLSEEGRALGKKNVEDVLGVPVVATVPVDAAVARSIDAGLLVSRVPYVLSNGLVGVANVHHADA